MGCLRIALLIVAGAALLIPVADGSAQPRRMRHRVLVVSTSSADAIELAGLAPGARRSTVEQTYGDAVFARARVQRRLAAEARADRVQAATIGTPYPCDPRSATASAYLCRNPGGTGYGQGYAFTPSYVSAPQVFGNAPDAQSPILPDVTAVFWAANGLRFDPH